MIGSDDARATIRHSDTGDLLTYGERPYTVTFFGRSETLPAVLGWYPDGNGDAIFGGEGLAIISAATKRLKAMRQGDDYRADIIRAADDQDGLRDLRDIDVEAWKAGAYPDIMSYEDAAAALAGMIDVPSGEVGTFDDLAVFLDPKHDVGDDG